MKKAPRDFQGYVLRCLLGPCMLREALGCVEIDFLQSYQECRVAAAQRQAFSTSILSRWHPIFVNLVLNSLAADMIHVIAQISIPISSAHSSVCFL